MPLVFLDKATIQPMLQAYWKRKLSTGEDPANGRWFESGAGHPSGPGGLYGALKDNAQTDLHFDKSQQKFTPEDVLCTNAIVDNLNGLTPNSTVTLQYAYTNSVAVNHTTSDSIKVGFGLDIKGKIDFLIAEGEATAKFSLDYTHSWSDSTTNTTTKTYTFSQSVPVTVPAGKVYEVVLTSSSQELVVPYTATIGISGHTETWFEDRVKGHYNWKEPAGEAFQKIGEWGLAGAQSSQYTAAGVTQSGTVRAIQHANFKAHVYDITDKHHGGVAAAALMTASVSAATPRAVPVYSVNFNDDIGAEAASSQ